VIVGKNIDHPVLTLIRTDNPYLGFARVLQKFFVPVREGSGISDLAVIEVNVKLGTDLSIYPHVYIGKNSVVGDRSTLYPGVCIGQECVIGSDVILYPNVSIMDSTVIGNRAIVHAGAVIGSDGFGLPPKKGSTIRSLNLVE